ncbi:hypothetical protein [Streptococcus suis]
MSKLLFFNTPISNSSSEYCNFNYQKKLLERSKEISGDEIDIELNLIGLPD